jgi:RNA polymerase sigma factor (sigma-70 family)
MRGGQLDNVLHHLNHLAAARQAGELPDRDLLERFVTHHDQAAFAAIVERHGPLVLSVCRRILRREHNAEDACQATFLVLARKAGAIRKRDSLGSWLYGVALRVARKLADDVRRRACQEVTDADVCLPDATGEITWREGLAVLDEELNRLPTSYRLALALCYLEGKSQEQAARELGCTPRALCGRLGRARECLRRRLVRRGLHLSAALLGTLLIAAHQAAALPPTLALSTVRAAAALLSGQPLARVVSVNVATLTEGVLAAMFATRLRAGAALVLTVSLLAAAGVLAAGGPSERGAPAAKAVVPAALADKDARNLLTIRGRVLDPDGKPVRAARVFVLDRPARPIRSSKDFSVMVAGETQTDAQGRFQLRARSPGGEPPPSPIHPLPVIFVRAEGHAAGAHAVPTREQKEGIVIRLPRQQVLRARFLDDTTNKPVKDLVVKVFGVFHGVPGQGGGLVIPPAQAPRAWFPAMKTDAGGRLQLYGTAPAHFVIVEWRDPRFRAQRLQLWKTEAQQGGEEVVFKLEPPVPELISGRVTFKDTGKPAAGVTVRTRGSKTTTDLQGRFRLKTDWPPPESAPYSGSPTVSAWVEVDAPAGSAYLGAIRHTGPSRYPRRDSTLGPWEPAKVDIALPRGVLVRGRVLEAGTNKGIRGATVSFKNHQATSGPDGTFSLTTDAGPGHLIVRAAADYAPAEGIVYGRPAFAHAIVPLTVKGDKDAKPVQVVLRRGVVVKGKLTGPDGQPVNGVVLISRLTVSAQLPPPSPVRDIPVAANFELRGCDPDKSYPVVFFQEQKGWGALVQVSGKQASKPLEVRLRPCGAAKGRYLGADGRPVAGRLTSPDLHMVLTPGDFAWWGAFIEHSNIRKDWHTDAQGRISWRNLVPGVTYRVNNRNFTVKPGEELDLGDIGGPPPK